MPGDIILLYIHVHHKWKSYDVWFLRYGTCDRQNFLSFWTIFCRFTPLTTQKSKFWKNEKTAWRYYHFTYVYHKWQSYEVWFLRYPVWWTELFVILDCFKPFFPLNPKNQNFEKLKTPHGDIIILHKCTKNHDHMLYCSLDMACIIVIFHFGLFFTFLPP